MPQKSYAPARPALTLLLLVASVFCLVTAAQADWLVLHDGSRVETQGPWQVKGAVILFHLPNGTLSSLRKSEVDLDASAKATTDAKESANKKPKPEAPKEAVLVVTDEDLKNAPRNPGEASVTSNAPDSAESEGDEADSEKAKEGSSAQPKRLEVTDWQQAPDAVASGGITITGTLNNTSNDVTGQIELTVKLQDEKGKLLATNTASLGTHTLQPGQHTRFSVKFPGVFSFVHVTFETRHIALQVQKEATGTS